MAHFLRHHSGASTNSDAHRHRRRRESSSSLATPAAHHLPQLEATGHAHSGTHGDVAGAIESNLADSLSKEDKAAAQDALAWISSDLTDSDGPEHRNKLYSTEDLPEQQNTLTAPLHRPTLDNRSSSASKFQSAARKISAARILSQKDVYEPRTPGIDARKVDLPDLQCQAVIQTVDCSKDAVAFGVQDATSLKVYLDRDGDKPAWARLRWIHVNGLSWDVIKPLAIKYDLHPLAVEDLLHQSSVRSKVDYYKNHAFVNLIVHRILDPSRVDEASKSSASAASSSSNGDRGVQPSATSKAYRDEEHRVESTAAASSSTKRNNSDYGTSWTVSVSGSTHAAYARRLEQAFADIDVPAESQARVLSHNVPGLNSKFSSAKTRGKRLRKSVNERAAARMTVAALTQDVKVQIHVEQLAVFLLRSNTIISFSQDPGPHPQVSAIFDRIASNEELIRESEDASMILEALLDTVGDQLLELVDEFRSELTSLEAHVLSRPTMSDVRHLHVLSSQLLMLKSTVQPLSLLLLALRNQDEAKAIAVQAFNSSKEPPVDTASQVSTTSKRIGFISPEAKVYIADVIDHVDSVLMSLDLFSDLSESLVAFVFNQMAFNSNSYIQGLIWLGVFDEHFWQSETVVDQGVSPCSLAGVKSFYGAPVTLSDLPDGDDEEWEPETGEPQLSLDEIRESIASWELEMKQRGRHLSGRTIVVVHSLPYVCTLHPVKSHTTSFDSHLIPDETEEPILSGTTTPLEIHPGDPLLRPRALHSPTLPQKNQQQHKPAIASFPEPARSFKPSFHPPCPPSRPASPLNPPTGLSTPHHEHISHHFSPPQQQHRWVLHPRRGHAALNSGLRSLTGRSLTVIGRPDDLMRATGESLGQADLGTTAKADLERGLKSMAGDAGQGIGCVPVWIDDKVHADFYELMCKTYLWPILHYLSLPDDLDKTNELRAWNAYYETNLVYAKKVAETYRPGDLIWIHDYHLLLVPKMLRELLPEAAPYISLFLHCPFPSSEYFRNLPRREELLDGMLGCNLVCFQTHSYARHFLSSCVRVMGYEAGSGGVDARGSITRIAHFPIGIDVDNVEHDRNVPGVPSKVEALRRLYAGKKIIVGRDKLDPTKGVLPKLRAFERFLHDYPEWVGKVALIQVTSPSPGDSPVLATKVSELVDHINGMYGSLEFQPVHHYHQTIERDEYFALLSVADLALITSIRDGMNTTSMEYILCQAEKKGPLIVSEFTGVSSQLNKAIKINPWDLGGVARAIDTCLKMSPEEREMRHSRLHQVVTSQTAAVWAHTNILKLLESLQGEQASQDTPPLDTKTFVDRYTSAKKRLLLFDYDGTLTPIVKDPSAAVPSESLLKSLPVLCADPRNVVYIISGRDGAFLEEHLGHIENLGMSAEHGCFLRAPGAKNWSSLTDDLDMDWKRDVLQIFRYYEARTQGAFVEKKLSSVTFHYRNADPVFGLFQAKECQAMLESMQESLPIDVLVGKKNVEVRPAHTNKGEIVQRLLYLHSDTDFVMCAGDDKTDEDMFHSLARILSSASNGAPAVIQPPASLSLFPSLANGTSLPKSSNGVPEALTSRLEPGSTFMIAIEAKETSAVRMTMANATLESPAQMVELLTQIAQVSAA
ncbi:hypothetical protein OIO90_003430 [Microbotryomycetes sp. JL221]|nr:hypothetical protein OIO90_003430 [Microbotryomycetes sp. JL221]